MTAASRAFAAMLKVPPALTRDIAVQRDMAILAPDGTPPLTDVYLADLQRCPPARDPGTDEPLATATTLRAAEQVIHHDPPRPSAVLLPATDAE